MVGCFALLRVAHEEEKKEWNNGFCPHCGAKFEHVDTEEQGKWDKWECPECHFYTWVRHKSIYKK